MNADKMKLILGGAGILLVFVAVLSYTTNIRKEGESPIIDTLSPAGEEALPKSGTGGTTAPPSSGGGTPRPPAPTQGIAFLSPQAGEKWVIKNVNAVRWSREAGMTGGISLLDATTRAVTGWLIPTTGIHDTSFSWNTQEVFLTRSSPSKKDIEKGDYILRMTFDGPRQAIESGKFSLVYAEELAAQTVNVDIKSFVFGPSAFTLKRGGKAIITNRDAVAHKLLSVGIATSYSLDPGQSFTIDTANMFPGKYEYYSPQYASLVFRLTVE